MTPQEAKYRVAWQFDVNGTVHYYSNLTLTKDIAKGVLAAIKTRTDEQEHSSAWIEDADGNRVEEDENERRKTRTN